PPSPRLLPGWVDKLYVLPSAFFAKLSDLDFVPTRRSSDLAAVEASMMHLSVPVAAPVIVTRPAEVTEQPTLPVPVAKVIGAVLSAGACTALNNSPSPNAYAGIGDKMNVNPAAFLAMLNDSD